MATTTSKRVLVSESQKTVATLEFNDWKLTINYEGEANKPVAQVSVTGSKGNGYVNFSRTATQTSINFNNVDYDDGLIAAIMVEVNDITKTV